MITIAKLFGKSPFAPLQTHMRKVGDCIEQLFSLFDAFAKNDEKKIKEIANAISELEHEADLTKNDIRNHLPKSLFLPIDRSYLLEILTLQDSLADQAEDIGVTLTLKKIEYNQELKDPFVQFCQKNIEAFTQVSEIIFELDPLLETSFGGMEAEKVKDMVEKIAFKEHEIDNIQYALLKKLYNLGDTMAYPTFHLWLSLIKEIGAISNLSEKLANRIRMLLELK